MEHQHVDHHGHSQHGHEEVHHQHHHDLTQIPPPDQHVAMEVSHHHQHLPHLQQLAHHPHDLPHEAMQPALPVAPPDYGHEGEGEEEHVQGQYLLHKRLMDDVLAQSSGLMGVPMPTDLGGPDKKRRKTTTEQQVKRHKYDVLKAFFRVYFTDSKDGMVLKDAIFNLYTKKIPVTQRIARNAMYRHMWSFFKNKISAFQSNYREYIKGIKLSSNGSALNYDGYEKDLDLLHAVGVGGVFDFEEEELEKSNERSTGVSSPFLSGEADASSGLEHSTDGSILSAVEQLEQQVKHIAAGLADLRARLKKSHGVEDEEQA